MNLRSGLFALGTLVVLSGCRTPGATSPGRTDPDVRVVTTFLERYRAHDVPGMMRCLSEDAVFRGSTETLDKRQIQAFLEQAMARQPDLQVEFGTPQRVQDTIQARVKIRSRVISEATWVFVLKDHQIASYSLQPGTP